MQKKFLSNLFLLLFLNLLVKPFWILGIDREVQNELGPEAYGIYFAIFNFSFLLNILLDLGITNYNNRNISQYQHLFHKYFPPILNLKFTLGILYFFLTVGFAWAMGYLENHLDLVLLLLVNQFLMSLILYLRSNFAGLHLFKIDSFISVLDRVLLIAFCGFLLLYQDGAHLSIKSFVLAQTTSFLVVCITALILLFSKGSEYKLVVKLPFSRAILRQSLPFALLVLLMSFYTRLDSVMLERLLPDGAFQAGTYAQSYRLLEAMNMIAFLFSTLLLPIYSKMLIEKSSLNEITDTALRLLSTYAIGGAIVLYFCSGFLIQWLYPEAGADSNIIFSWLVWNIIPMSGTYIFGTLLTANGSLKALNSMAFIGVTLNVILNFWLIPEYKAVGAVWATVATQSITFFIQLGLALKLTPLKIPFSSLLRLVAFIGLVAFATYFITAYTEGIYTLLLGAVIVVVSALVTGLLQISKALNLLRS